MIPMELGLAFLMGLGGSVHCLGMCSGFALAVARGSARRPVLHQALYSSGRLSAYMFLGLLAGTLGQSLQVVIPLQSAQTSLAIVAGIIITVLGLRMLGLRPEARWQAVSHRLGSINGGLRVAVGLLSSAIRSLTPPASPTQALSLGLVNGLLPCPVVYAVLPMALATGSGLRGGLLMLALGAGTLPMMLGVAIAGRTLIPRAQRLARLPGLTVLIFGLVTLGRAFLSWGTAVHTMF